MKPRLFFVAAALCLAACDRHTLLGSERNPEDDYNPSVNPVRDAGTEDAGCDWRHSTLPDIEVHAVLTAPDSTLYGATDGFVYRSIDVGQNWDVTVLPDVSMRALSLGLGDGGVLIGTEDAGVFELDGSLTPTADLGSQTPIQAVAEGAKLLAGTSSGVLVLDNGGWTRARGTSSANVSALGVFGSTVLAVTHQGDILRSTNGGLTFTPVTAPLPSADLTAVVSGDGAIWLAGSVLNTGISPTRNGVLFESTDDGQTFTDQSATLPSTRPVLALAGGAELAFAQSAPNGSAVFILFSGTVTPRGSPVDASIESLVFNQGQLAAGTKDHGVLTLPLTCR